MFTLSAIATLVAFCSNAIWTTLSASACFSVAWTNSSFLASAFLALSDCFNNSSASLDNRLLCDVANSAVAFAISEALAVCFKALVLLELFFLRLAISEVINSFCSVILAFLTFSNSFSSLDLSFLDKLGLFNWASKSDSSAINFFNSGLVNWATGEELSKASIFSDSIIDFSSTIVNSLDKTLWRSFNFTSVGSASIAFSTSVKEDNKSLL